MGQKHSKDAKIRARQYLRAQPGASNAHAAKLLGISVRTVSYARAELVKEGKIAPALHNRGGGKPPKPTTEHLTTSGVKEIEAELNRMKTGDGKPLEDSEKLARLAAIARTTDDSKRAESAMLAHTRIKELSKEKAHLGPKPPLKDKEKIDRLWALIEVCGPTIAAKATVRAFKGTDLTDFCTTLDRLKATAPHSHPSNTEGESAPTAAVLSSEDTDDPTKTPVASSPPPDPVD